MTVVRIDGHTAQQRVAPPRTTVVRIDGRTWLLLLLYMVRNER